MPASARPSTTLALKLVLLILVPALLLVVVLGRGISKTVDDRAVGQAERQSITVSRALDERFLARVTRARRLGRATRRHTDAVLGRVAHSDGVSGVRLLAGSGRVVFSSRAAERGGRLATPGLAAALRGRTFASRTRRKDGVTIDTFVPLRAAAGETPVAALQLEVDAPPAVSATSSDMRRLYLILTAGLALLCAGTLRVLSTGLPWARRRHAVPEDHARDSLTGLPNRELFNEMLEKALADCPHDGIVAVLLMDLDRFKEINDSLGHFNGDLVIERVGKRLASVLREGDLVARLGGDEFAMVLPTAVSKDSVVGAAKRIHDALEEPFTVGGLALRVEASIGAALYPHDGDKAGKLLQAADVAMYAAKKAHTGHEFYAAEQHQYTPARLGLVAQLDRAMEKGELVLHYQPKARMDTRTIEGVEALARWNHPTRGLLLPDEFIPVTEHTSMIRPVTIHLLETALAQVQEWSRDGLQLNVAVNLSAQLLLDLKLPREIGRMLSRVGAAAGTLEVEITESAIMSDPRRAQRVLDRMREMGVRIAIDDFGTGYSSLVSLKQLPVDAIKVDKSFVLNMENDSSDAAIVRSTVALGHNLGLEVVAEGVENQALWDQLATMGADTAQGYYLSKPLPPDRFDTWLAVYQQMFGREPQGREPASRGEAGEQSWDASTSSRPPASREAAPARSGS
jgi:diguanylate cyclase (GGDEF)-like protein